MNRARAAALFCAPLAACSAQTPPPVPQVITQRVEVPVPVKCSPDLGPDPDYISAMEFATAPDIFAAVILYKRDRLMRIARDAEKTAALRGCAGGSN